MGEQGRRGGAKCFMIFSLKVHENCIKVWWTYNENLMKISTKLHEVLLKFSRGFQEKSMKSSSHLNSFLRRPEVFRKLLELSGKFLICQNVWLSLFYLAFLLQVLLNIDRKLVWNSIWTFFGGCNDLPSNLAKTGFCLWKESKRQQNSQNVHFSASRTAMRF